MNRPALLDFDEALRQLLALARPPEGIETLPTQAALDRVLATDQVSGLDVPSMDNSQMDGWAVRIADLRPGTPLPVSQRIPAGAVAAPLAAGSVARIFTGAMLPEGADAVVMQEQAEADGDRVRFPTPPAPDWPSPPTAGPPPSRPRPTWPR
jgi:molybdopterin molybdotransferase